MPVPKQYQADVNAILARRHDSGGDYWARSDGGVYYGSPFSTIESVLMLSDLGMGADHPILRGAARQILSCWHDDGRFRAVPGGAIYPCHTTAAARALCRLGYARDSRIERTFQNLVDTAHVDGGWRCSKFMFGRGPETESSNPGPTLNALDAFRFSRHLNRDRRLDRAVEFLLAHWRTRKPLGPCHFGMGTRFMKVEYPLLRYNLLNYVYVLSFYDRAKRDQRFREALQALNSKLVDGSVVVENAHKELAGLSFCRKGSPSRAATHQYLQILRNLREPGRRPLRSLPLHRRPRERRE